MRIAVDVQVGRAGAEILRAADHDVFEAKPGQADREWFAQALRWGAELVVSPDSDIEILCWDHDVPFVKAKQVNGVSVAYAVLFAIVMEA